MGRIKAAVLGATGIVGQQFVRMLEGHPHFEMAALTASPAAVGLRYDEAAAWMLAGPCPVRAACVRLCRPTPADLEERGVRVVFSGLPADVAGQVERKLAGAGMAVFTNAGANRMRSGVPIVVPEVNPEHLQLIDRKQAGFIVANANCSTTGLVLGLKPLMPFGIRSLEVCTYQAVSGAGLKGLAALRIADNVIPLIEGEEEKMVRETRRILGRLEGGRIAPADIDTSATCCRVPVSDGHLEAVIVELDRKVDVSILRRAFESYRGVPQRRRLPSAPQRPLIVRAEPDRPQPVVDRLAGNPARARGMAVSIGRLRVKGLRLRFLLLVHNTVRGAAGTSLLNAELCRDEGRLGVLP